MKPWKPSRVWCWQFVRTMRGVPFPVMYYARLTSRDAATFAREGGYHKYTRIPKRLWPVGA